LKFADALSRPTTFQRFGHPVDPLCAFVAWHVAQLETKNAAPFVGSPFASWRKSARVFE
jgi:hypothetical protein